MTTILIVITLALIHFSYVDFRFRYREGFMWFWGLRPAPPLMWIGRLSIIAAIGFALSLHWIADKRFFALVLGGILALHIISLVLLEVLEPRS